MPQLLVVEHIVDALCRFPIKQVLNCWSSLPPNQVLAYPNFDFVVRDWDADKHGAYVFLIFPFLPLCMPLTLGPGLERVGGISVEDQDFT